MKRFLFLSLLLPLSDAFSYNLHCPFPQDHRWTALSFQFRCWNGRAEVIGCTNKTIVSRLNTTLGCVVEEEGVELLPAAEPEFTVAVLSDNMLVCTPGLRHINEAVENVTWAWTLKYRKSKTRGDVAFAVECNLSGGMVSHVTTACIDEHGVLRKDGEEWITGDAGNGHRFVRACSLANKHIPFSNIFNCYDGNSKTRKQHGERWTSPDGRKLFQCLVPVSSPFSQLEGLPEVKQLPVETKANEKISENMRTVLVNGKPAFCINTTGYRVEMGEEWKDRLRKFKCVSDGSGGVRVATIGCIDELTGTEHDDGMEWIIGRFIYKCVLNNADKEIEAVGCLNNYGDKVELGSEWKSEYHHVVLGCVRNETVPISAWMPQTACLDSKLNRITNASNYETNAAIYKCLIDDEGRATRRGIACRGQNGVRIENGSHVETGGFRVDCSISQADGHIRVTRGINCSTPGLSVSFNSDIILKCTAEVVGISEKVTIHPKVQGCVRGDGALVNNQTVFYEKNTENVLIVKRCNVHEFYSPLTSEFQFHGGIVAEGCKLYRDSIRTGCYAKILNDSIAYCRFRRAGEVGEAELGVLPDNLAYRHFLASNFGLRFCGETLLLTKDQIPGHNITIHPLHRADKSSKSLAAGHNPLSPIAMILFIFTYVLLKID